MALRHFKRISKSRWSKLFFSVIFIAFIFTFSYLWIFDSDKINDSKNITGDDTNKINQPNQFDLSNNLTSSIDSILFTFGIKIEWITNETSPQNSNTKGDKQGFKLFRKTVLIPQDVNSAEVNLEFSNFIKALNLKSNVTEDFKTKNLIFQIENDSSSIPLAIVKLNFSNQISRQSTQFVLILDKLRDYTDKEREDILSHYRFSYLFSPDIDDIEFQSKLSEIQKNILVNFTVGNKDSDADFIPDIPEKDIIFKIKSFKNDHTGFKNILLTGYNTNNSVYGIVLSELKKSHFNVIQDTLLTSLYQADSKSPFEEMIKKLYLLAGQRKKIISVLSLSYNQFQEFNQHLIKLKRLGHKFISVSEYFELEEKEKKMQEELLKKKQSEVKQTDITKEKKTSNKKTTKTKK